MAGLVVDGAEHIDRRDVPLRDLQVDGLDLRIIGRVEIAAAVVADNHHLAAFVAGAGDKALHIGLPLLVDGILIRGVVNPFISKGQGVDHIFSTIHHKVVVALGQGDGVVAGDGTVGERPSIRQGICAE